MRGDPAEPKCKGSKTIVETLTKMQIKFKTHDVLKDDHLKEWLKFYSNWPSYPQVFINQKFIGGTEIILDMVENDQFLDLIPSDCIKASALERIAKILNKSVVVLMIKGTCCKPADGYQKRALSLMQEARINFTWYDVTSDNDVREILKE